MSSPPPSFTYADFLPPPDHGLLRLAENVIPLSDFKAQTASLLRDLTADNNPRILTQNGKAAAVVLSPAAYDDLALRGRFLAAVSEGLIDVRAGRVHSHDEVVARARARFAAPAAPAKKPAKKRSK